MKIIYKILYYFFWTISVILNLWNWILFMWIMIIWPYLIFIIILQVKYIHNISDYIWSILWPILLFILFFLSIWILADILKSKIWKKIINLYFDYSPYFFWIPIINNIQKYFKNKINNKW